MITPKRALAFFVLESQDKDQSINCAEEKKPDINERIIIITRAFRCMGFMDELGIWRHSTDHAPIENVLKWTRNTRP